MSTPEPKKVAIYIDGFNLYHAIHDLKRPHLKWLNLFTLGTKLLRDGEALEKVHFFTTVVDWNAPKRTRHQTYLMALAAKGVKISHGNFKKASRHCSQHDRHCPFREEKQTDVAIGVQIVADAFKGTFERMILLTADTDQIPAVEMVKREFPNKDITWLAPPGRMQQARELGDLITDRSELSSGMIQNCRLPRVVMDAQQNIVCSMPNEYAAPNS
ncbi:NYN domain-containing protein [Bradyrhizobium sp. 27S5]|uniref:NYN domain-containing protein n=1 Tax=Bradyrhizobium sp. 27S5 TaxID=3139728 RepID=UPI0030CB6884